MTHWNPRRPQYASCNAYSLPLLVFLLFISACNNSSAANQAQSDYAKLCKIYEEVTSKPGEPFTQSVEIAWRVQQEIPNVYVHFENISSAFPTDAYRLFKEVAEKETGKTWDCKAMKDFYSAG